MKYYIEIVTGKKKAYRDRVYTFETDESIPVEYFTCRRSLSGYDFPKYVKGLVSESDDSGGSQWDWKDFDDFSSLGVQNIVSISVNGVDINNPIIEAAKKLDAEVNFPTMFMAQFTFSKKPEWVYNWYITTGTLSKQKKTDKYFRMTNLGNSATIENTLNICSNDK